MRLNLSTVKRKSLQVLLALVICSNMPCAGQDFIPDVLSYLEQQAIDSSFAWLEKNKGAEIEVFTPVASQTLKRAYSSNSPYTKARAHSAYATWNAYIGHYTSDTTLYHNLKAIKLYKQAGDQEMTAKTLNNISADYSREGNYEASISSIMQAIEIYEDLGDEVGVATGYKNLGFQFGINGQHEKAIEYSELAMERFSELNEYALLTYASVNILESYNALNMEDKALRVAARCLEIVKTKVPEEVFVEMKTHAIRHETYLNLGRYDEALKDAERAYEIAVRELGVQRAAYYRLEIGNVLRLQGNCEVAIPHLKAASDRYREMERFNFKDPSEFLADCYEKLGEFEKALDFYKDLSRIEVDLLEGTITNLETEAVIKYETGKKDQAIAERDTKLKQNAKVQLLTIGIAVLLALFLGMLYYYFQRNKKTSMELAAKNDENELLLKEIHHRVKNNLQTISSLLNLQSESISDERAFNAVQESKNRVASMALIHQKLYQGENLAAIEMKDYFKTIGKAVIESFGEKAENVSLNVEMETVELDVDTAVPIGLITNELLTNSLKYAFTERADGIIKISLSKNEGLYELTIADNGSGISNKPKKGSDGFGTMLIKLLALQLGGNLEKDNSSGTSIILSFKDESRIVA